MKWTLAAFATLAVTWSSPTPLDPACCYFSALGKDVNQPGQKAFLTWDPVENIESFTVQPKFEGNAENFGMVVPTPGRPRLQEVHRDFFKQLAQAEEKATAKKIIDQEAAEKQMMAMGANAQATAGQTFGVETALGTFSVGAKIEQQQLDALELIVDNTKQLASSPGVLV